MKTSVFEKMDNETAFGRVTCFVITHPKKTGKHAVIRIAHPKDGAGRLTAYCLDYFGETCNAQRGQAGGYGYDKVCAAMSGFVIDGKTLTDHCGQDETSKRLLKQYVKATDKQAIEKRARKLGYQFANYTRGDGYKPTGADGYQSCYKDSGLDYLRTLGYSVIQGV